MFDISTTLGRESAADVVPAMEPFRDTLPCGCMHRAFLGTDSATNVVAHPSRTAEDGSGRISTLLALAKPTVGSTILRAAREALHCSTVYGRAQGD